MVEERGSVTNWINELRGDAAPAASGKLWERYLGPGSPGWPAAGSARHAAASRMRKMSRSASSIASSAGPPPSRYPNLGDRDDLWRLLVTITGRKAFNLRRHETCQKRGSGKTVGTTALAGAGTTDDDFLAHVVGARLTPESAAVVVDEYRRLFGSLADESLRVVALLKLEGYSNGEIAKSLDCGLHSVERKLDVIRKRWRAEGMS